MNTIKVYSTIDNSKSYEYIDDGNPKQGGVKDVYFSPNRKYVVAFFRAPLDFNQKERIKRIVSLYLETIKNGNAPEYFLNNIFRWPYDTVEKDGKTGVIVPIYDKKFFFTKGRVTDEGLKGEEKKGKWYTTPSFRDAKYPLCLDKSE